MRTMQVVLLPTEAQCKEPAQRAQEGTVTDIARSLDSPRQGKAINQMEDPTGEYSQE